MRSSRAADRKEANPAQFCEFPVKFPAILALRDKPKILSRHDAEIIGDSIAEKCPFFREGRSDEGEDSLPELAEGRVVPVVGHVMAHQPPASIDGIEVGTV